MPNMLQGIPEPEPVETHPMRTSFQHGQPGQPDLTDLSHLITVDEPSA